MASDILLAAAVIPAAVLLILVYRADRLEKEPKGLLFKLLAFGALSAIPAIITELLGDYYLETIFGDAVTETSAPLAYLVLEYFVIVAISEEGFKYLFLNLGSWRKSSFDCQFDGVVYAVFVSLGFAIFENILYVFQLGLGTALVRAFTAIPGHATFGVFMGVWYGIAKRYALSGNKGASTACRFLAIIMAVFTHGMYDFLATIDNTTYCVIFFGYILVLFSISFYTVYKASKADRYIV